MIPELRREFNGRFSEAKYRALLQHVEAAVGIVPEFRVAETPVFVTGSFLGQLAREGERLAGQLLADPDYLFAARRAIPPGYCVAGETAHPHFLTADFALARDAGGALRPKLVEMQAFPSIFGFQAVMTAAYREAYDLPSSQGYLLGGLREEGYWELLRRTIVGAHDPENVVLTEIAPEHQKTRPDFVVTAQKLGIQVADIARLEPVGDKLHYRNAAGRLIPIHRIYNRAIADELIARKIRLPFDWTRPWQVEWAGHPNWYFLISKFSVPWLARREENRGVIPPAVFLDEFLAGPGRERLVAAGVELSAGPGAVYHNLLLKPLFGFAGKGIQFDPSQAELDAIDPAQRGNYLLQQRMHFVPTIETPHGPTQAEFRILYLWPEGGKLQPAICLVRLGRGRMMGVDHNRNQAWVGASAALYPARDALSR